MKTGRSAFPSQEQIDYPSNSVMQYYAGMTLRDYFAARAPQPAPDWFKHEPSSKRPVAPDAALLTDAQREQLAGLGDYYDFTDVDAEVVAFAEARDAAAEALEAWRNEQRRIKFFAWRWFYADMMIKTREAA